MTHAAPHQLNVEIKRFDEERVFLYMSVMGKLGHGDYVALNALVDRTLADIEHPHLDALVNLYGVTGIEWRAAWDDVKFGLKHYTQFRHVAVVCGACWEKWAMRIADWFTPGQFRSFKDESQAKAWLKEMHPG